MITTVELNETIILQPRSTIEEVMQNVRMIMGVWRGSVPLDRDFGLDADLLDAPINAAKSRLAADLAAQIIKCEPRAKLKSLTFEGNARDGTLMPIATIIIGEESL